MSGAFPLGPGATPDWLPGYVPSAAEWNMWWSNKVDSDNPELVGGPFLPTAGGTMLGALVLAGPPTQANQACTKAYADSLSIEAGPFLSLAGGTMTGVLTLAAAYPPVGPNDATPKQYVDQVQALANQAITTANGAVTTANNAVPRSGAVMTGFLTLAGDPTGPLMASTKQYADNHFLPFSGGTVSFINVGGTGINFPNYSGGHRFALNWDGSFLTSYVDGSYIGQMATVGWVQGNYATIAGVGANYYTASTTDARYLYKGGDTCTGSLTVNGNLTANGIVNGVSGLYVNAYSGFQLTRDGSGNCYIQFMPNNYQLVWNSTNGDLDYLCDAGTFYGFAASGFTGDFFVHGSVYAANVSDARTKRNVTRFPRGLTEVLQLDPVAYEYNGEGGTNPDAGVRYGFTAQDVEPLIPEAVHPTWERVPEGKQSTRLPGQLSLDTEPILCAAINAIKELATRLSAVESELRPAMKA